MTANPAGRRITRRPEDLEELVTAALRRCRGSVSAYRLAQLLNKGGTDLVRPQQVYRVLDRLIDAGLVQKIEAWRAYLLVKRSAPPEPLLLLCRECASVEAITAPGLRSRLAALAQAQGFAPSRFAMELIGRCAKCAGDCQEAILGQNQKH